MEIVLRQTLRVVINYATSSYSVGQVDHSHHCRYLYHLNALEAL